MNHAVAAADSITTTRPLIEALRLERWYGDRAAVGGIDFRVDQGEVVGFLGPNGAGKSTTMQMLAGALAPSSGSVRIDGHDLATHPGAAKRRLGYLPEQPPLYRELSVDEYLRFCARLRGVAKGQLAAALSEAKNRCGLEADGRRLIGNLSKGYQQRVGIAQAIVHDPAIVILDEPTSGLDPIQIRDIRALIRELGNAHCVILSTHILAEVQTVCDRVVIIRAGRIVLDEHLANLTDVTARAHTMRLTAPPSAWPDLRGVGAFETLADRRIRVHHDGRPETLAALLAAAVGGHWGLTELVAEHGSLEELFVSLTLDPETAAPGSAP